MTTMHAAMKFALLFYLVNNFSKVYIRANILFIRFIINITIFILVIN